MAIKIQGATVIDDSRYLSASGATFTGAVSGTTFSATTFTGALSGNADTATTATSATYASTSASCTGNASTATLASDSNKLIGKNWYWSGQGGQPTWLWGGSDGTNMYVWNPANFSVAYANNAGNAIGYNQSWQDVISSRAGGTTYTNSTGKPIFVLLAFYNDIQVYLNAVPSFTANNEGLANATSNISLVIPNGSTYRFDSTYGIHKWLELR